MHIWKTEDAISADAASDAQVGFERAPAGFGSWALVAVAVVIVVWFVVRLLDDSLGDSFVSTRCGWDIDLSTETPPREASCLDRTGPERKACYDEQFRVDLESLVDRGQLDDGSGTRNPFAFETQFPLRARQLAHEPRARSERGAGVSNA
jgi:hypothetical protein